MAAMMCHLVNFQNHNMKIFVAAINSIEGWSIKKQGVPAEYDKCDVIENK